MNIVKDCFQGEIKFWLTITLRFIIAMDYEYEHCYEQNIVTESIAIV